MIAYDPRLAHEVNLLARYRAWDTYNAGLAPAGGFKGQRGKVNLILGQKLDRVQNQDAVILEMVVELLGERPLDYSPVPF